MNDERISQAELDDLVPIYRRGVFDRDLPQRIAVALERKEPLAVVMIDLDRFKSVNDQYGHQVGDEVLLSVATTVRQITGTKGSCYRYGGEELAVVLPNYSADEAAALAERIRRKLESVAVGSQQLKVTASFGVAELLAHEKNGVDLLKKAEEALYEAKNLG